MSEQAALEDEERRMQRLRSMVDTGKEELLRRPLSRAEAEHIVIEIRRQALQLFPDKGDTFDLIYGSRFRRLIEQRFSAQP